MQNQMNTNHQSYKQYEQKFLEIRDKLLQKRTQIYSKPKNVDIRQEFEFQLSKAASAAEEILRRFPIDTIGPIVPPRPVSNPFGALGNDRDMRIRDPPNIRPLMMAGRPMNPMNQNNQNNNWKPKMTPEQSSEYPNNKW